MLTFAAGMPISGRYLLTERLHASRGAQLWSAFDDVLGRPVVVKFFPRAFGDEQALTRLHARARSAARLSHAGLVGVLDFGTTEGLPYVVLNLVDGVTLARRIEAGRISPDELQAWTGQIATALAATHARGVVHGYLDADVLFITGSGAMLAGMVASGAAHPPATAPQASDDVAALTALIRSSAGQTGFVLPDCTDAADLARAVGVLAPPAPKSRSRRILVPAGLTAGIVSVLALGGGLSGLGVAILPTAHPAANAQSNGHGSTGDGSSRGPALTGTPSPSASAIPTSPGATPATTAFPGTQGAFSSGVARVRAIALSGRELGEINEPTGAQLLEDIDKLTESTVDALIKRIERWERGHKITAARSDLLCDALKVLMPKPAATHTPAPPTPPTPTAEVPTGGRSPRPKMTKSTDQVTGRPST